MQGEKEDRGMNSILCDAIFHIKFIRILRFDIKM